MSILAIAAAAETRLTCKAQLSRSTRTRRMRASPTSQTNVRPLSKGGDMKPSVSAIGVSRRVLLSTLAVLPALAGSLRFPSAQAQADPLPSWNDGPVKSSISDFVARVTMQGGPDFVPVQQRIATFDNDGTLWIEQPMYIQLAFALDRV